MCICGFGNRQELELCCHKHRFIGGRVYRDILNAAVHWAARLMADPVQPLVSPQVDLSDQ